MLSTRQQIAEMLLECSLDSRGFAPCPGHAKHSHGNGKRDFRVCLDGAPTAFCFHTSCSGDVEAFNKELRRRIWIAEHGSDRCAQSWGVDVAPAPMREDKKRPPLNLEKLKEFVRATTAGIDENWLRLRSPLNPPEVTSGQFLDALFEPEERVLVFTRQTSQGDFLWWSGHNGYRLSPDRNVKAVSSSLPSGTRDGVWFLVQPVSGKWEINGRMTSDDEPPKWTRRSEVNVTSWKHFVLESDEAPADLWLRAVAALPLPIAAIYTSGKRSIHALVKHAVSSKAEWDATRDVIRQVVCPLGADPAALTAVRLSRLPGCTRSGTEQRLLYLNPHPDGQPLLLQPEVAFA